MHITGGFSGLVGACILGEREEKKNKKNKKNNNEYENIPMMITGVLILWFGWYGLNSGINFSLLQWQKVSRSIVNTTVAAGSCGICTTALRPFIENWNEKRV